MQEISKIIKIIMQLEDTIVLNRNTEFIYQSDVMPSQSWSKIDFQNKLNIQIPPELSYLWSITSEVRIHIETNFFQWGVVLWSPFDCLNNQDKYISLRPEDFKKGDLIIGEYLGDQDLILIRCNPEESDFSNILIAESIEPRSDWLNVSNNLIQFLTETLDNPYVKFWE